MVVDRAKLSSSEPSVAASTSAEVPVRPGGVYGFLLSQDDDTRLLLRGLLRLFRHRVVFEGRSPEELEGLPPVPDPRVLLLDAEAVPGGWESALAIALAAQPGLRPILLTLARSEDLESRARAAGVRVVLARPFRIAELTSALATACEGG